MPMFLSSINAVWLADTDFAGLTIYLGKSLRDVSVLVGIYRQMGQIKQVFAKPVEAEKFDKEIKQIKANTPYDTWYKWDFTSMTPLQQEEAAQVRGLLFDAEDIWHDNIIELIEQSEVAKA